MITIKEEFLGDEKTQRAMELGGCLAVVVWLGLKTYAATHLTDGFIPDEACDKIPGMPRGWRKAMMSLIACGKLQRDGQRGAGLVEAVKHGFQLHDYLDHANSGDEERERKRKAREQKQRRREELRRLADEEKRRVTGQPLLLSAGPSGPCPADSTDSGESDKGHDSPRAHTHASGPARAPSPTQPNPAPNPPSPPDVSSGIQEVAIAARTQVTSAMRQELSMQQAAPDDFEVFDVWRKRYQKTDTSFTADRALHISERRREGMTQQDALDAVVGAGLDPWFVQIGAKLSVIFNAQERYEGYRDVGRAVREGKTPLAPAKNRGRLEPRQPNTGNYSAGANAKRIS